MKWADLGQHIDLSTFPWDDCLQGMARATKGVSTFYGDNHHGKYDPSFGTRTNWRWYNALKTNAPIESFAISLNLFFGDYWWARFGEPVWQDTAEMQRFPTLQRWIRNLGIFEHTGRQGFFLNLHGQSEVKEHRDYDPSLVPEEYRAPPDFIWLTPPSPQRKHVYLSGELLPSNCVWFDTREPHRISSEGVAWSFRVDGKFKPEFKEKLWT